MICCNLSPTKKSADNNEQNTPVLFPSCKTYNLGAPGTVFLIKLTFVIYGLISKGYYSYPETIKYEILATDTWKFSIPTHVIVKQYLVVYLEYFNRNELYHHVPHTISGQYVCYNNCLLQFF